MTLETRNVIVLLSRFSKPNTSRVSANQTQVPNHFIKGFVAKLVSFKPGNESTDVAV